VDWRDQGPSGWIRSTHGLLDDRHHRLPEVATRPGELCALAATQGFGECQQDPRDKAPFFLLVCCHRNLVVVTDRQTELLEFPSPRGVASSRSSGCPSIIPTARLV
jgi:hypothetical protein